MVRIRLARVGKHKVPFYRIVAIDSRKHRDARALEIIGTYDALNSKIVSFDFSILQKWVQCGAQVSDSAKKVIFIAKKQNLVQNLDDFSKMFSSGKQSIKKPKKTRKAKILKNVEENVIEDASQNVTK